MKRKPLVFVLDDEKPLTDVITTALTQDGALTVKSFHTAADLQADADLESVDLFIIDVRLKDGISGFELPMQLPARCRLAAFLFMSGYTVDLQLYERSKMLSLFDFIAKPFTLVDLKERVNSLLSDRVRLPEDTNAGLLTIWQKESFVAVLIDHNLSIRLANDKMARMLGMDKPRDLVGQSFKGFLTGDCIDQVVKTVRAIFAGDSQTPSDIECEVITAGGQKHRVVLFCSAFEGEENQRMVLSVGIISDHRRRHRLRYVYRQMLIKDRATIRNIKPLKLPEQTCTWGAPT